MFHFLVQTWPFFYYFIFIETRLLFNLLGHALLFHLLGQVLHFYLLGQVLLFSLIGTSIAFFIYWSKYCCVAKRIYWSLLELLPVPVEEMQLFFISTELHVRKCWCFNQHTLICFGRFILIFFQFLSTILWNVFLARSCSTSATRY